MTSLCALHSRLLDHLTSRIPTTGARDAPLTLNVFQSVAYLFNK